MFSKTKGKKTKENEKKRKAEEEEYELCQEHSKKSSKRTCRSVVLFVSLP